ncbi:MAG: hypothetical protein H0V05_04115 [Euzebyaceae bacterium]|nr:hypothetical protein [Euzebyaceae bacterium]
MGGGDSTLGPDLGDSAVKWAVLDGETVRVRGAVPTPLQLPAIRGLDADHRPWTDAYDATARTSAGAGGPRDG